jgi:hypothetical protein
MSSMKPAVIGIGRDLGILARARPECVAAHGPSARGQKLLRIGRLALTPDLEMQARAVGIGAADLGDFLSLGTVSFSLTSSLLLWAYTDR